MPITDIIALSGRSTETLADQPEADVPRIQAKDIHHICLAELGVLLNTGSLEELKAGFKMTFAMSEEGPWLMTIPTSLTQAVKNLNDEKIIEQATEWGQSEELVGIHIEDLVQYLQDLRHLILEHDGPYLLSLGL